ncbi:MAG: hypothetical protein QM776_12515 [Rhodocyclaceae bacterium]
MQKKLIAVAVAGLMSGGAFAQVTVGGKFDASYQFRKIQNFDTAAGAPNGGTTTEAQTDGSAASTRVTFSANEDINKWIKAGVSYDVRFGNVHEGKTGLTSNDKKAMWVQFGPIVTQYGVANLMSGDFKLAEKPYMVSPKDWEAVKYGVSQFREESLTNRHTAFWTDPKALSFGPVGLLFKGSYAGGDNRKAGSNNDGFSHTNTASSALNSTTTKKSGDVYVLGLEYKITDVINGGIDGTHKRTSNIAAGTEDGIIFHHYYINIKPVKGLKIGLQYNNYKGYLASVPWQEKTTNIVINYTIGNLGLGAGFSQNHDLSDAATGGRNSGKQMMLGAFYQLSKQTSAYIGYSKADWERNTAGITNGKYVGSGTNFVGNTGNKVDEKILRVGIVKDF